MNAADGDVVSVALKCLHSKATEDHKRALDIVEKVADDDPIACDLLRYRFCFDLPASASVDPPRGLINRMHAGAMELRIYSSVSRRARPTAALRTAPRRPSRLCAAKRPRESAPAR